MSDLLVPSLNGVAFDGTTVDADGLALSCSDLEGWWDSADMRSSLYDRVEMGQGFTALKRNARGITLSGFVHRLNPSEPVGKAGYRALRNMKAAIGSSLASVLLEVPDDDVLTLQARVNQVNAIRTKVAATGGVVASITFQIPLLAQDPRRYGAVVNNTGATGSLIVTNAGDVPAPFSVLWPPGTTTASITNNTLADAPTLTWVGSVVGGLLMDTGALTVMDGGSNAFAGMTSAEWFQLAPGDNDLTIVTTVTNLAWQDAYS